MSSTLYAAASTLAGPPAVVTNELNYVLNILAWLVTAAGVCGLMIVGTRMAISLRSGEGDEHLSRITTLLRRSRIGFSRTREIIEVTFGNLTEPHEQLRGHLCIEDRSRSLTESIGVTRPTLARGES